VASNRILGASGAMGIGLLGLGLFLPGPPVTTDQPTSEVAELLATEHVAFGVSMYLAGLGLLAMCLFAGALYRYLATNGDSVLAAGAAIAAVAGPLLIVVGMSLTTGLALGQADGPTTDPSAAVRAGVDTGNVVIELAKFALAALVLTSAARRDVLPRALRLTGLASAAVLLASALPPLLCPGGVGELGGPVDLLGSVPGTAWVLVLSVLITLRPHPRPVVR